MSNDIISAATLFWVWEQFGKNISSRKLWEYSRKGGKGFNGEMQKFVIGIE